MHSCLCIFATCAMLFPWFCDAEKSCVDDLELLGKDQRKVYKLIDAALGDRVEMPCHFCNDNEGLDRQWFSSDRFFINDPTMITPDDEMEITSDKTLIILNFMYHKIATYSCVLAAEDSSRTINYIVDSKLSATREPMHGGWDVWRMYHIDNMHPINYKLEKSTDEPFKRLREAGYNLQATNRWEPWSKCSCGDTPGWRTRMGTCRVRDMPEDNKKLADLNSKSRALAKLSEEEAGMLSHEFTCHSMELAKSTPVLSDVLREIPDFILEEKCIAVCDQGGSSGSDAGSESHPELGSGSEKALPKEEQFFLEFIEDKDISFHCPQAKLESTVKWTVGAQTLTPKHLKRLFGGRARIDLAHRLRISSIVVKDQGTYRCFVDGIPTGVYRVSPMNRLHLIHSRRFVIYLYYLLSALLLWFVLYIAIMVILWSGVRKTSGFLERLP